MVPFVPLLEVQLKTGNCFHNYFIITYLGYRSRLQFVHMKFTVSNNTLNYNFITELGICPA